MALQRWRERFPRTACQLATQHTVEIVEALLLREADLGLTLQAVEHPGLCSRMLTEGRMRVIAPPGCWAQEELDTPVRLQALAGRALIGLDTRDALGSLLRGISKSSTRRRAWSPGADLSAGAPAGIGGAGRGLVDPFTALATDGGEVQTRLLEPAISVPLYALTRVHEQPLPAQAMLLDALGEQAARLLQAEHA